jgi:hypothetical protein
MGSADFFSASSVSVDIRTTFRFEPISGARLMTSDGTLTWKHEQHVIEAAISTRKVVQRRDIIMVGIIISIFCTEVRVNAPSSKSCDLSVKLGDPVIRRFPSGFTMELES